MAIRQFDKVNTIKQQNYSEKIKRLEDYFGEMDLPEDEIQDRVNLADNLDLFFKRLFVVLAAAMAVEQTINREYYYSYAANGYADTLTDYGREDLAEGYRNNINATTQSIVDTTFNHPGSAFYISDERAIFLAMNESNAVLNYDRDVKAREAGYTSKVWITKFDDKVRETHKDLHNEKIGIYDTFLVGVYDMRFPLDITLGAGPEEVCNCRCVCKYVNENEGMFRYELNEGIFHVMDGREGENTRWDLQAAFAKVQSDEFGKKFADFITENNIDMYLCFGAKMGYAGQYEDNTIWLFGEDINSQEELECTIIHEATHAILKDPNTFAKELECTYNEARYLKMELTKELKAHIVDLVYEKYPDLR